MSKFTIKNIKELVGITDSGSLLKKGSEMNKLSTIQNAFLIRILRLVDLMKVIAP